MSKNRNIRNAKRLIKSGVLSKEAASIRKTRCFKQVSAVIGEEAALRELLRVVCEGDDNLLKPSWADVRLSGCFVWSCSPQGHQFWSNIDYSPKFPR